MNNYGLSDDPRERAQELAERKAAPMADALTLQDFAPKHHYALMVAAPDGRPILSIHADGTLWISPEANDNAELVQRLYDLWWQIMAKHAPPTCTGCGAPRIRAIETVVRGGIACCPDCSTLTMEERNAIRGELPAGGA